MPEQPAGKTEYSLTGTVDAFDGNVVVIKTQDNQLLRWPIKQLPDDIAVGATVRLVLRTTESEQAEREAVAKTILNEILKP